MSEKPDAVGHDMLARPGDPVSPPSIEPIEVTEAMVEESGVAYYGGHDEWRCLAPGYQGMARRRLRAAIIAALAARG